jgi:hypothetical protein
MGGMLGAEGIRKDHQIFVPHPPSTSRSCLMLTSSLVLECSTVVRSRRYQVKHIQRRETKVLEAKLHASYGDLGNLHYPKAKSQKPKKNSSTTHETRTRKVAVGVACVAALKRCKLVMQVPDCSRIDPRGLDQIRDRDKIRAA